MKVTDKMHTTKWMKVTDKMHTTGTSLRKSDKSKFAGLRDKILLLSRELDEGQSWAASYENLKREAEIREELNFLLDKEETFWMQKTPVNKMREEDRNTAFLHAHATEKKRRNTIRRTDG